MKLHILSDLHLEFESFEPPQTDSDAVVLAGDIHIGHRGIEWAVETFPDKPVIYVNGNHEFYGQSLPGHYEKIKNASEGTNVHTLENEPFVLDGVAFLGCTLWSDFELFGNAYAAEYQAAQWMNDYRKIRIQPEFRQLRPGDTAAIFRRSLKWLANQLKKYHEKKIIMISHHAPSRKSLPQAFQDQEIGAAFASDLEEFIKASNISCWIHGHLHQFQDYYIGNTRVICNPRGYPTEDRSGFIPDLVMTV